MAWNQRAECFARSLFDENTGIAASVPNKPGTLYGTCYALQTIQFLGGSYKAAKKSTDAILSFQDPETGLFRGPELTSWKPEQGALHDETHLLLHLTCATLPVLQGFGIAPLYPLAAAHAFCDKGYLHDWLDQRDLHDAWFEGNNLLFVGQLLVYLRDHEKFDGAREALEIWFEWLDRMIDPNTGLWGTNGYCGVPNAVYGGYHQLLVYYYENRTIRSANRLVDSVLSLQHFDGGFRPWGGGGACEDVDAVDILVNLYKRYDYRRPAIKVALRRCVNHILSNQNSDGGFSYSKGEPYVHMGIPTTSSNVDESGAFPTWFRVHTLALIAQVLTDHPALCDIPWSFSQHLSMGWHDNSIASPSVGRLSILGEMIPIMLWNARRGKAAARSKARHFRSVIRG